MSKRVFHHPPEAASGRKYWRSLGQLGDTPEFRQWLEREFPQGASEFAGGEVSRRSFLQLMGASTALAGLTLAGCRRPEKHLVPFTRGVEWSIPGKALFYATARPWRNGYAPVVAQTNDGRPTKVDGNPLHPASKGASDTFTQASLLDLYDPDRSRHFTFKGEKKSGADFEKALDELIGKAGDGAGLAFLVERNPSPTRERLRGEVEKKFPKAAWCVYEPLVDDGSAEASRVAFGEGISPVAQIANADVIMALDADFLGNDGNLINSREFGARRSADGDNKMNRLYVVENRYTVTGGMADHRLRVQASQIGAFALALAEEIAGQSGDGALGKLVAGASKSQTKFKENWAKVAAEDLVANKGKSLVLIGSRQPAAVQALGLAINAALGNLGKTIAGRKATEKPGTSLVDLAQALGDKKISTLVIMGGNPVYNAPADLDFAAKLANVETVIRVSSNPDETTESATWQVPGAHYLEFWGDGRAIDGSYVSVQPMIMPLFDGWSELDMLAKFAGQAKPKGPELVQETFRQIVKPDNFTEAWAKFLHDGFQANTAAPAESLTLNADALSKLAASPAVAASEGDNYEVVFVGDSKVDDGRLANNGWMQELPDPITKMTWDNAAWISPATAKKLDVEQGHLIEITVDNRKLDRIVVAIAPGHADNSITIPLGYGRTHAGRVGTVGQTSEGFVIDSDMTSGGFNAYPLRTTKAPYFAVGAKVKTLGKSYRVALTQEHGTLEGRGPDLVREATLEQYKAKPDFTKAMGVDAEAEWKEVNGRKTEIVNRSLYSHPPLNDIHQWGMTVDLNACTGCGACMVACQSENNIPIVGKRQVIEGREMHWIRCDRYFASADDKDIDEPEMVSQPMMCQHCENAPCETVCPVNATVHSEDGLNVMAYNRCIGTRYCANNCPFKVRRFNFFDYNQRKLDKLRTWNWVNEKGTEDTIKMSKNPNVTVRMRGVMEKCTFCVQRVQEAKIAAKAKGRDSDDVRIPANSFTSACAQVCPTEAIVFGDIANPDSAVSKLRTKERGYRMLEYLNINPRVTYLARIRNPNPKMPDAARVAAYMGKHEHGAGHGAETTSGGHH